MKKTFYKTIICYEVLSEEPLGEASLEDIHSLCMDGPCSGRFLSTKETRLNGRQTAHALKKQGSDPSFFHLSASGREERF